MNFKFLDTKQINKIAVASIAVFTIALSLGIHQIQKNKSIEPNLVERFNLAAFDQNNSPEQFLITLNKEDTTIWEEIEQAIGITKEQFIAMKQEDAWHKKYNNAIQNMIDQSKGDQILSKDNIQYAEEMLSFCGLNPKKIAIVAWKGFAPAASTDNALLINQAEFDQYSREEKKFILVHEISHIINGDHSTSCMLEDFKEKQPDNTQLLKVMDRCSHFCEIRADIFSTSHGKEFAQGHVLFAQHELKSFGNKLRSDYPSNGERLEIGQKLLTIMKNNFA